MTTASLLQLLLFTFTSDRGAVSPNFRGSNEVNFSNSSTLPRWLDFQRGHAMDTGGGDPMEQPRIRWGPVPFSAQARRHLGRGAHVMRPFVKIFDYPFFM